MSAERTSEETKQRYIELMGAELGTLFHVLSNELAWLYAKWGEYVELFGTKPSRIDLVNRAAGFFFRIVQDSLWEDALLHIARLTDPPKSAGRQNLTIRRLPELIDDPSTKERVSTLINTATGKSSFCRDWRNRHIAHKDLNLALRKGAEPLEPASRAQVKEALDSLSDILNAVSLHFDDSTTSFEGVGSGRGAISLLYVIDDGLQQEQQRRHRLATGDIRAGDYGPRDL
jgi:AbiU2